MDDCNSLPVRSVLRLAVRANKKRSENSVDCLFVCFPSENIPIDDDEFRERHSREIKIDRLIDSDQREKKTKDFFKIRVTGRDGRSARKRQAGRVLLAP